MSNREAVLRHIAASDGYVSGSEIAASLGISRVAVGKHVNALRRAGYTIEARKAAGYRLSGMPQSCVPEGVALLLTDPMWIRVEGAAQTTSTNDDARALARGGAVEGTVAVAAAQTAGRGRLGRSWLSPVGGAYVSVVLRPCMPPVMVGTLGLAVGVGVARGLARLGVNPELKWPNDVLIGGAKVAGILLEMSAEAERIEWVVAGIGVNVERHPDAFKGSAFVTDAAPGVTPASTAAAVLDGVASAYAEWTCGGFAPLLHEYSGLHVLAGRPVRVSDANGAVVTEGECKGVDEEGRLLVASATGTKRIVAGEVTLRD